MPIRAVSLLLCLAAPLFAQAKPTSLLDGLRDRARPVLVFGAPADPLVPQQYGELAANASGLHDRQLTLVLVTTSPVPHQPAPPIGTVAATLPEQAALRRRFHVAPNVFTVILLGKDGGEKFRSSAFVSFSRLAALVDAMLMRQQEMQPK